MKSTVKNNRGIALVVAIMMMVLLLSITGASLLFSGLNLKIASNLKTTSATIYVADAGIQHALVVIPSGSNFNTLLQGGVTQFPCTSGTGATCVNPTLTGSLSGYTYSVVVGDDADEVSPTPPAPTDDKNKVVIFTSTGTGSNGSQRKIKAYIGRLSSSWTPPSALYFTGVSSSNKFFDPAGKLFCVDGNDASYTATGCPTTPATSAAPIPGIGTNDSALTTNVINSLSSGEKPLIQGTGYSASPLTPSVQTVPTDINIDQLATDFYNRLLSTDPCPPKCTTGFRSSASTTPPSGVYSCPNPLPTPRPAPDPCVWGTDAAPQITYISEGTNHIHIAGNVTGSGVLVLEGKVHLQGDFNFHGLVIVKEPAGSTSSTDQDNDGDTDQSSTLRFKMRDNAKVFGTMLVGPNGAQLRFDIKGSAKIYYSKAAIDMVQNQPLWGPLLPQPAKLLAWQEVMQ